MAILRQVLNFFGLCVNIFLVMGKDSEGYWLESKNPYSTFGVRFRPIPKSIFLFFPKGYLKEFTIINYVDATNVPAHISNSLTSAGCYMYPRKTIFLAGNYQPKLIVYTLIHEVGHHIWFTVLDDSDRMLWTDFWKKKGGLTNYADTNEKEDFAEYYALTMYGSINGCQYHTRIRNNDIWRDTLLDVILRKKPIFDLRKKDGKS